MMIPYGRQTIGAEDIQGVIEVLRSDFLTQGPVVPRFESAIVQLCGVPNAVAVNSATSALHIACLALGVGPGDRVWTSPNTFVASANCARYCGAAVDFVDIDPATYNMSMDALAAKLSQAHSAGTLPKVVIPVHFAGLPCDMKTIHDLSRRYGFKVIEDASHAIGARYADTIIGDCRHSDIAVFSFHPVKIITTAEGGLATTRSSELAHRMRLLRTHGISRDPADLERKDEGPWYYEQRCLGFNYRMTELQGALGLSQLPHLEEWIARRHAIADSYDAELAELPLNLPQRPTGSRSALHLYVVKIDSARTRLTRRVAFERLRAAGVGVNVHYIPVHTQPDFRSLGFCAGQFPESEAYYARCMSIPMFAGLTDSDQSHVVQALREALSS
ncbi:MAG TPA: UDP-4-amino-4,6-dideoxy-N-acetyl-beta-L-altrosamine transaminase [Steroidobacteraceae bacterium]|jgi:UDP-4-amino-4,6-dideoxy-N-acetyl-beta-L-altrosamine transaminase|nr:UDP-4-amino-4,6-dideoxy-N-acetyl-beta-L-altrosamine transaminase [Steroidobacteraceae bacterium]